MSQSVKPISTTKLIIARAVDATLITALAFGNEDGKTFAFWMVSMMVVVLFIGALGMTKDTAAGMAGGSLARKVGLVAVQVTYVIALVYAGFPVLAALYAMAVILLAMRIDVKSKQEVTP